MGRNGQTVSNTLLSTAAAEAGLLGAKWLCAEESPTQEKVSYGMHAGLKVGSAMLAKIFWNRAASRMAQEGLRWAGIYKGGLAVALGATGGSWAVQQAWAHPHATAAVLGAGWVCWQAV